MENCVILEVGTTYTRGMVIEPNENGTFKILAIAATKSTGVKKGEIVNIQHTDVSIKSIIKKLSEESETDIRTVNLIYSGGSPQFDIISGMKTLNNRDGFIEEQHINIAQQNAMERELPEGRTLSEVIPLDYFLDKDQKVDNPIRMSANSLTVNLMRLHVDKNRLNSVLNLLDDNSIDYSNVYLSGLVSAIGATTQQQRQEGVLVINLGGGTTTWAVYTNKTPRHVGGIPIGGDHITNDIHVAFKSTLENSEKLKCNFGSATIDTSRETENYDQEFTTKYVTRNDLSKVINARIDETIRIVYDQISKSGLSEAINTVVLCGKGAYLKNIDKLVENIFQVPCSIANPKIPFSRMNAEAPTMAYVALLGAAQCCTKEAIQEENRRKKSAGFFSRLFQRSNNN